MNPHDPQTTDSSRRSFLDRAVRTLGGAAAVSLLSTSGRLLSPAEAAALAGPHLPGPHFPGKAKHVIYMHMVGGPSQIDLYDYKPKMNAWYDKDLPESIRQGQRLTTMTSGQTRFPIAPSKYKFAQYGQNGMWISELLPNTAKVVDEMCFVRSMNTDAINHEPAITFAQTGNQIAGRPCLGSWASYGLGTLNQNLPTFVVMVAKPTNMEQLQAISARLWSSGYLPGEHAGVSFRTTGDPILYINNPPGVPADVRRMTLDGIRSLNEMNFGAYGDPDIRTRTKQYELALRMQDSVPELADLAKEPKSTFELYGEEARKPGTFANTALQARRMVERGVRFVQIYHNNWDSHGNVAGRLAQPVQRRRPGLLRIDHRFEAARPAEGDAHRLGRRVRPHDLFARRAVARELRPRPPPAVLHDVDGRRRRQAGHGLWRNRRFLLQYRQRPREDPRLPRHDPASPRFRPRTAELSIPGT